MEAKQCQKLPSTAACLRRQVTTQVKRVVVGCLSAREIKFALPWPKLVSELGTAVSGVSHEIPFQTLPLGGRGRMQGCVPWSEYTGDEHGEERRNRRQRKRSSVVIRTRRHSVKTSEGMFQWPLEDPEMCQATRGTLIWCQSGGRNKIYTYQNEAFNSLAICPPTPPQPPQKVFPNWPQVLILLSRVVQLKKRNFCLTKLNSWVATAGWVQEWGDVRSREREATGGGEGKEMGVSSLGVGLSETDPGNHQNFNSTREAISEGMTAPFARMLTLSLFFPEQIHLEEEWRLRAKAWVSVKQNTWIHFTHNDDGSPSKSFGYQDQKPPDTGRADQILEGKRYFQTEWKRLEDLRAQPVWLCIWFCQWHQGTRHLIYWFIS